MVSNDLNLQEFDQVGDTYSTLLEKLNLNNDQLVYLLKLIMSGNNHETFELGEGKSVITLRNDYLPNNNSVQLFINGSQSDQFEETDNRTITLLTPVTGTTNVSVYYKSSQNFPSDSSSILSKYTDMYKDLQSAKELSEAIRDVLNKNGEEVSLDNQGVPLDYGKQINELNNSINNQTKSIQSINDKVDGLYTNQKINDLVSSIYTLIPNSDDYNMLNQPSYYIKKIGLSDSKITLEFQSSRILDEDDKTTDGIVLTEAFKNSAIQLALVGSSLKIRNSANSSQWNSWSVIYDINKPNGVDLNELNSIINNKISSIDSTKYIIFNRKLYKTAGSTLNLDATNGLPIAQSGTMTMSVFPGKGVKSDTSTMTLDTSMRVGTASIVDTEGNVLTDANQIESKVEISLGLYAQPANSIKGSTLNDDRSSFNTNYPNGLPAGMLAILYREPKILTIYPSDIEQNKIYEVTTDLIDIYGNSKGAMQPLYNLDSIKEFYTRNQKITTIGSSNIRYQVSTDSMNPGVITLGTPNYYSLVSLDGSIPNSLDMPSIDTYWLIPFIRSITVY